MSGTRFPLNYLLFLLVNQLESRRRTAALRLITANLAYKLGCQANMAHHQNTGLLDSLNLFNNPGLFTGMKHSITHKTLQAGARPARD